MMGPDHKNLRRGLIVIGALGLLLRLALALEITPVLLYDSLEYHQTAAHLAAGQGFYTDVLQSPTATMTGKFYSVRAPGYVFFIAAIYRLAGENDQAVAVVQALLDCLSGIFLFLIARYYLPPRSALIAYLGQQLLLVYVPMLMSEALFIFLFLFSLWILLGPRREKWGWTAVAGVLWGLMVLTRPEKVIFVPLFAGWLAFKNYSRPAAGRAAMFTLIVAALIAPWLWREYQVHGRFVWMTTRGGMTFFDGSYLPMEKSQVIADGQRQGLDEAGLDRLFFRVSLDYLRAHPAHYLWTCLKRVRVLTDLHTYDGLESFFLKPLLNQHRPFPTALAYVSYSLYILSRGVMVLGLIAAFASLRRRRELFILYAIPVVIILFHFTLFLGKPRYLVPAYPVLCIFMALGVEQLEGRGWFKRSGSVIVAGPRTGEL